MTTRFNEPAVENVYTTLRLTYGLVPLAAGADKFLNLLTDWPAYVSPLAASALPMSPQAFMYVVGVIEMAVGVLVVTQATTKLGAWVASAWLVLIALNLVTLGAFDIAVRDIAMAVGAYCLARLAELRETSEAGAPASMGRSPSHSPAAR